MPSPLAGLFRILLARLIDSIEISEIGAPIYASAGRSLFVDVAADRVDNIDGILFILVEPSSGFWRFAKDRPLYAPPMTQGDSTMRFSSGFRAALVALVALASAGVSSAAHADSGTIWISEVKGGWFIGASGGSGTLIFHGRAYPLSVGGLSAGLVFGASVTRLSGRVSHIRRPSDVAGVYGAAGAGAALGVGGRAIVLSNEKGAVLTLSGPQVGLIANADLSGLAISLP